MKIRLLQPTEIGASVRPAGDVVAVVSTVGRVLIAQGRAVDAASAPPAAAAPEPPPQVPDASTDAPGPAAGASDSAPDLSTRAGVRAALDARGVAYDGRWSTERLRALLGD